MEFVKCLLLFSIKKERVGAKYFSWGNNNVFNQQSIKTLYDGKRWMIIIFNYEWVIAIPKNENLRENWFFFTRQSRDPITFSSIADVSFQLAPKWCTYIPFECHNLKACKHGNKKALSEHENHNFLRLLMWCEKKKVSMYKDFFVILIFFYAFVFNII